MEKVCLVYVQIVANSSAISPMCVFVYVTESEL